MVPISRRYEPGTLVIETTWVTDTGWVVVHDALTIADWVPAGGDEGRRGRPDTAHESDRSLLRTMTCIDGEVEMEMECAAALRLRPPRARVGAAASSAKRSPPPPTGPSCC